MKKDTRFMLIIVSVLIVLFMMSRGYSYAKYASSTVWNYYLESKGFYFNSDLSLGNTDNNWDGSSISFDVRNYDNSDSITDYDINYKVTCTIKGDAASYSTCHVNGTDSNVYNGILTGGIKSTRSDYFEIVSNEEITGITVEVKLESISPYSKTINGEYVLSKGVKEIGGLSLSYNPSDSGDKVVITNSYNENKCCKLSFDSNKLRIDDNSNFISSTTDSNGYIKEVLFNINKKDSLDFTFYRTDFDANLTSDEFTLVESEDC